MPPESAGRHAPSQEIRQLSTLESHVGYLCSRWQELQSNNGIPLEDIAVLCRYKRIEFSLRQHGIPVEWCNRDAKSRRYHPNQPSIKLLTMHSSKGFEFSTVFLPFVDQVRVSPEEVWILYVAMTRAIDRLIVTHTYRTALVCMMRDA